MNNSPNHDSKAVDNPNSTSTRKKSRWGPELSTDPTTKESHHSKHSISYKPPRQTHHKPRDKHHEKRWNAPYRPPNVIEKSRPTLMSNFGRSPVHSKQEYQSSYPRPSLAPFSIDMLDNYETPTIIDSMEQNEPEPPKPNLSDSLLYEIDQQANDLERIDLLNKQQLVAEIESLDDEISKIERELSSKKERITASPISWPLHRISIDNTLICDIYRQSRSNQVLSEQAEMLDFTKLKKENESNIQSILSKVQKTLKSNKLYQYHLKAVYQIEYRKLLSNWSSNSPQIDTEEKPVINHSFVSNPIIRSEEAYNQILLDLIRSERNDPSTRWMSTLAKPSPMLISFNEMDRFIDNNAHDPCPMDTMKASSHVNDILETNGRFAAYSPSIGIRPFTKIEANIFMEKYLSYPKRWDIIAKALYGRTHNEIIQYYYENKKKLEFKKWLRIPGQKKKTSMIGNILTSGKVFRHALSETMLDMIHQDEHRVDEQEKFVQKRPGRPRKHPIDNLEKVKKKKTKNNTETDDTVIIPSIALEFKNMISYEGFPLDYSRGSSNGIVFWLPAERSFLIDCYRKYGKDWETIAKEFESFRKERIGNPSCGRRLVQKDYTLTCLEKALKDEVAREKIHYQLDSKDAVILFFKLYKNIYRIEDIDINDNEKKINLKSIANNDNMMSNITTPVPTEEKISISEIEVDALSCLENLASIAQEEIMMINSTSNDYPE